MGDDTIIVPHHQVAVVADLDHFDSKRGEGVLAESRVADWTYWTEHPAARTAVSDDAINTYLTLV